MPSTQPTIVALAALSTFSVVDAWMTSPVAHTFVSDSASSLIKMQATSEAAAKAAWMAKLDAQSWGQAVAANDLVDTTYGAVVPTAQSYDPLSAMESEVVMPSEADAKAAWMSKLDAPAWGAAADATPAATAYDAAPAMSEAAAKAAWLAKLDVPTWGAGGASPMSEAAAKAAWLAKLDAPVWGGAAMTAPVAAYDAPIAAAPSSEADAKAAWMAKLDAPAWGSASTVAPAMAAYDASPAAAAPATTEAAAKAAWLASLDAPVWGR